MRMQAADPARSSLLYLRRHHVPESQISMRALQRFAAVIMRIRDPKTTALVFASGKMVSPCPSPCQTTQSLSGAKHQRSTLSRWSASVVSHRSFCHCDHASVEIWFTLKQFQVKLSSFNPTVNVIAFYLENWCKLDTGSSGCDRSQERGLCSHSGSQGTLLQI